MIHIESYDSYDDAMKAMAEASAKAKTWIKDFQRPLMDGKKHFFMRLYAVYGEVLVITGWTYDLDQLETEMMERYGQSPEGAEEVRDSIQSHWDMLPEGYILTEAYSAGVPYGERGDTHAATMLEITEAQFNKMCSLVFDPELILKDPELAQLCRRWVNDVSVQ